MHKFDEKILDRAVENLFSSLEKLENSVESLIEKRKILEQKLEKQIREHWEVSSELSRVKDEISQFMESKEKYDRISEVCKLLSVKVDEMIELISSLEKHLIK
ncbi:MAG: hypothetical protein N3G21_09375 [Candidatus Hydrogenedentes bacterium]|nr:hypothetical protein [Candidatus Hydrogenedentota bacterium]